MHTTSHKCVKLSNGGQTQSGKKKLLHTTSTKTVMVLVVAEVHNKLYVGGTTSIQLMFPHGGSH